METPESPSIQNTASEQQKTEDAAWIKEKINEENKNAKAAFGYAAAIVVEAACRGRAEEVEREAAKIKEKFKDALSNPSFYHKELEYYTKYLKLGADELIIDAATRGLPDTANTMISRIRDGEITVQTGDIFTQKHLDALQYRPDSYDDEDMFRGDVNQAFIALAKQVQHNPTMINVPTSLVERDCDIYTAAEKVGVLDAAKKRLKDSATLASAGLSVEQMAQQTPKQDTPSSGYMLNLNAERIPGSVVVHADGTIKPALWQAIEQFNAKNPASAVDKIIPAKQAAQPGEYASGDQYILHISDGDSKALLQFINEKFSNSAETTNASLPRATSPEPPKQPGRG